jgi:hypothetical protein
MTESADSSHKTGKAKGIIAVAFLSFLFYVYSLFPFLFAIYLFSFGIWLVDIAALYFVVGLICSWKLFSHRTWSWYLAIIMSTGEGLFILLSFTILPIDPNLLVVLLYPLLFFLRYPASLFGVLSIGVFRLASAAYLTTKGVRKTFAVNKRQIIDYLKSFRIEPEYRITKRAQNETLF